MRSIVLWAVLALILGAVNGLIWGKERILAQGESMLLELAPRDPRSLLQGDYMSLVYRLAQEVEAQLPATSADGSIVVQLDRSGIAHFVRLHAAAQPLAAGEKLLRFRKRGRVVRLASDAFFFQEGQDEVFRPALYGELRVDRSGDAVLVGLRDAGLQALAPAPRR